MNHLLRKLLALALVLCQVCLLFPAARAEGIPADGSADLLTEAAYASADAIFADLDRMDEANAVTMSNRSRTQAVYDALCSMEGVVEGSVEFQGADRLVWYTDEGVSCVWSTRINEILTDCTPTQVEVEDMIRPETRGTHGRDVYLIEPYYGIDKSFTGQYQREARAAAQAMGGNAYFRIGDRATIDAVAAALQSGGLIIFDSHGNTDYDNGADATTGATTSYLCLSTKTGVTKADYNDHHVNYRSMGGITFCEVDGVAISNHMTKDSDNAMIWAAICLGMATDGLCGPLRERGVAVMYGYSQSVSFAGDYCFEEVAFENLIAGRTVAESIGAMKARYGYWDYSRQIGAAAGTPGYDTIEEARKHRCAFPIVSSAEDPYPGHGNVDDLQEVYSTWRLVEPDCAHRLTELRDAAAPGCGKPGYTGDLWCRVCGELLEKGTEIPALDCRAAAFGDVDTGKWYHEALDYVLENGIMNGMSDTVFAPNASMTRAQLAVIFYQLENRPACEAENPFTDAAPGKWYTDAIVWAYSEGIVAGLSPDTYGINGQVTREQVVAMLYRYAKAEPVEGDHLAAFHDGAQVHGWALDAMNWAVANGYIAGSDNNLTPRNNMTRAQVAQFFMSYLKSVG